MSDDRHERRGPGPPPEESASGNTGLERLREEILDCDRELVRVLARRKELVREVGALKARLGRQVTDPGREAEVARRAAILARHAGVDEELVRNLIWQIMAAARKQQYPPPAQTEGDPQRPRKP
ncbi:MAG: chorismate mutase [Gemmatimonadetes bacterium]|nr:chorismate mutase [Gemmatimonadota bacterium]MYA65644.1 chorismate mutase [Gemmatimonadota bacterium]MYB99139.1 chorismate mutase [Gemmatimonadota bacterium]MYH54083.1 chorismate mutase [Gemmatimonadota bacterium]MYI45307.1 chorismate mutase [Gemmatimonadota bacterium]